MSQELEKFIREETKRRWNDCEQKGAADYSNDPLSHFPLASYVGFTNEYRHKTDTGSKYLFDFFSDQVAGILEVSTDKKDIDTMLDAIFKKCYRDVINIGDPCDFRDEGYIPQVYLVAAEAIKLAQDHDGLRIILEEKRMEKK